MLATKVLSVLTVTVESVCIYFISLNLCQKKVLKINMRTFMLKVKVE